MIAFQSHLAETAVACPISHQHLPTRQGATGFQKVAGLPRFRTRACRLAAHESNVKVIQSTRTVLKLPGRPQQGFPDFLGRAYVPRGDAGAVIPCCQSEREGGHAAPQKASKGHWISILLGTMFQPGDLLGKMHTDKKLSSPGWDVQAAGLKPVVDYTKKKVAEVHLEELKASMAEMLAAEPPFPVADLISSAKGKKAEWQLLDADIVKVQQSLLSLVAYLTCVRPKESYRGGGMVIRQQEATGVEACHAISRGSLLVK